MGQKVGNSYSVRMAKAKRIRLALYKGKEGRLWYSEELSIGIQDDGT